MLQTEAAVKQEGLSGTQTEEKTFHFAEKEKNAEENRSSAL